MPHLELEDNELEVLEETVASRISGLNVEIAHTDHREFRQSLKERRDTLTKVWEKMRQFKPAGATLENW